MPEDLKKIEFLKVSLKSPFSLRIAKMCWREGPNLFLSSEYRNFWEKIADSGP